MVWFPVDPTKPVLSSAFRETVKLYPDAKKRRAPGIPHVKGETETSVTEPKIDVKHYSTAAKGSMAALVQQTLGLNLEQLLLPSITAVAHIVKRNFCEEIKSRDNFRAVPIHIDERAQKKAETAMSTADERVGGKIKNQVTLNIQKHAEDLEKETVKAQGPGNRNENEVAMNNERCFKSPKELMDYIRSEDRLTGSETIYNLNVSGQVDHSYNPEMMEKEEVRSHPCLKDSSVAPDNIQTCGSAHNVSKILTLNEASRIGIADNEQIITNGSLNKEPTTAATDKPTWDSTAVASNDLEIGGNDHATANAQFSSTVREVDKNVIKTDAEVSIEKESEKPWTVSKEATVDANNAETGTWNVTASDFRRYTGSNEKVIPLNMTGRGPQDACNMNMNGYSAPRRAKQHRERSERSSEVKYYFFNSSKAGRSK